MDAILDTSVIIEIFRGNKGILDELKDCGIPVITLFELHCGTLKDREVLRSLGLILMKNVQSLPIRSIEI